MKKALTITNVCIIALTLMITAAVAIIRRGHADMVVGFSFYGIPATGLIAIATNREKDRNISSLTWFATAMTVFDFGLLVCHLF